MTQPQGYDRELNRTAPERYSYSRLGLAWLIVPALITLCGLAYVAIAFVLKTPIEWVFVAMLVPFGAAFLIVTNCDDQWHVRHRHKQTIRRDDPTYRFLLSPKAYEHTTFTDNPLEYLAYVAAKVICYAASVVVLGVVAVLAFAWLGSFTIAPTTVIIILLLIIIYNQEKARK